MSRARRRFAAAMLGALLALPAGAHHAWTEVDTSRTLTLTGTVRELHWENPHAHLVLETDDGAGKATWTVLMSGIARMEARGLSARALARGATLIIVGSPARTEPRTVRANHIEVDGTDHVLY